MLKLLMVTGLMVMVSCKQPVLTVKLDNPRDTVYINTVVHDTIVISKLNKYERNIVLALRNGSTSDASNIINQYNYDRFPHKCADKVSGYYRVIPVRLALKSLPNGLYGYVDTEKDILQCKRVINESIVESWEIHKTGKIDTTTARDRNRARELLERRKKAREAEKS